jgi:hypothetical protein
MTKRNSRLLTTLYLSIYLGSYSISEVFFPNKVELNYRLCIQAFEEAWAAACKVEASTVLVPSELEFVVGPISFSGPYCKPNILFQLDGTILAQTSTRVWGSGLLQWLEFTKLSGISIQGSGVINGRGQEWWTYSDPNDDDNDDVDAYNVELEKMPQIKPTALRFYGSSNVTVTGITIVNSSQCHLKFDSCQGVMVHDLTISSPENSPNTDGIHLQNSKQVSIHHSNLACGNALINSIKAVSQYSFKCDMLDRNIVLHSRFIFFQKKRFCQNKERRC